MGISSLSRCEDQNVWNHQVDQTVSYDSDRVTIRGFLLATTYYNNNQQVNH